MNGCTLLVWNCIANCTTTRNRITLTIHGERTYHSCIFSK